MTTNQHLFIKFISADLNEIRRFTNHESTRDFTNIVELPSPLPIIRPHLGVPIDEKNFRNKELLLMDIIPIIMRSHCHAEMSAGVFVIRGVRWVRVKL